MKINLIFIGCQQHWPDGQERMGMLACVQSHPCATYLLESDEKRTVEEFEGDL